MLFGLGAWHLVAILASLIILILGLYAIRKKSENSSDRYERFGGITYFIDRIKYLEESLREKDIRIKELLDELDHDRKERDAIVNELRSRIDVLKEKISMVEASKGPIKPQPYKSTTLLITTEKDFQITDELALRKARVPYRRIINATLDKIEDEFRRRRRDGTMFDNIIISAHMDETGVHLVNDELLTGIWLSEQLAGVKLIILNGCRSTDIADMISGIVDYVISMTEDVPNDEAGSFLTAFWRSIVNGKTIIESYNDAIFAEPPVSPFVDIQTR